MDSAEFPWLESFDDARKPNTRSRVARTLAVKSLAPLTLNDHVTVTLSPSTLDGRIVWLNGQDCGIAFDQAIALASGYGGPSRQNAASHDGAVRVADKAMCGRMAENDRNFQPGLKVRVILDDGGETDGIIRWSHDNIAGLTLLETIGGTPLGSMPEPTPPVD